MQLRTKDKQNLYIHYYKEYGLTKTEICKKIGISRWTYYSWIKKYPEFLLKIHRAYPEHASKPYETKSEAPNDETNKTNLFPL